MHNLLFGCVEVVLISLITHEINTLMQLIAVKSFHSVVFHTFLIFLQTHIEPHSTVARF